MARISRRAIAIGAPLVAIGTFMIALRVGAGDAVKTAAVFAAPPGRPAAPDGPTPLALQVLTYLQDRGVKETIPISGLTVVARAKGRESTWRGDSNGDGIAEANLELPGLAAGDDVEIEIRAAGDAMPLAQGPLTWKKDVTWSSARESEGDALEKVAIRPSKRDGAINLDVVIDGERLVVGERTPIWVHVGPPHGVPARGIALDVVPEPGLSIEGPPRPAAGADAGEAGEEGASGRIKIGCDSGWLELGGLAEAHVIGLGLTAHGAAGTKGSWFGALPVALGAFLVHVPRFIEDDAVAEVVLEAPNPRNVVYVEIDDEKGRVWAAALPVTTEPGDPTPRARFTTPKLARGLHWIVTSGEPRGAERLAGAAIAHAFLVGGAEGVDEKEPCAVGPWLASRPGAGFPRWHALDGMSIRGAQNRKRHMIGLLLGVVSLGAAALLEILLMIASAREANAIKLLAELEEDEAEQQKIVAAPPGGSLAIGILLAVLGFALLAALFVTKS